MDISGLKYVEAIERIRTKQDALRKEIRLIQAENLNLEEIFCLYEEKNNQLEVLKKSVEKQLGKALNKIGVTSADLAFMKPNIRSHFLNEDEDDPAVPVLEPLPQAMSHARTKQMKPDLPKDLVEEILCRVPATSLKQIRCCKWWDHLFKDDRNFARKHFDKAAKQSCLVLLTREYTICPISLNLKSIVPSIDFFGAFRLPYNVDISRVVHCDGLLLCSYHNESSLVVWNPLTGETRLIDNNNHPKTSHRNFVFGYSQNKKSWGIKSYKILSFFLGSGDTEIYEFNSNSWRMLADVSPAWRLAKSRNSVSLKGKPYWFAVDRPERHPVCLVCFDFSTDKFERVRLPYQCYNYFFANISLVGDEKLAVLLQQERTSKTEIWVTNKTQVVSWIKVFVLDPTPDIQISEFGSFLLDEEKKVFVWCTRWLDKLDTFDKQKCKDRVNVVGEDNKVTSVDISAEEKFKGCWPVILNYVPSLVHIEQSRGKRKRGD